MAWSDFFLLLTQIALLASFLLIVAIVMCVVLWRVIERKVWSTVRRISKL